MKKTDKKESGKFSFKERFSYWFDNRMKKGSLGFIRILIIASVLLALLIAGLIIILGFSEDAEPGSVFWDSIATVINAWMPSFEDGSPGYIILMAVIAIAGLLFTSVLIGIITSAIEEKIDNLKRGNSRVLEKDHIVVLGFYPGEYTLLRQLILAAAGEPSCIVIAEDMEREEMEQNIADNVDTPKNVKIVCRTVDITDPASIEKCSLEKCKTVIISPTDDMRTVKAVLAATTLLREKQAEGISVNAITSNDQYRFPASMAEANNISTFRTGSIFAKMIAHSCTQTGLSETFREIFNFDGSEFYITYLEGSEGLTFKELTLRTDNAVPTGVLHDGKLLLNPGADYVIAKGDKILIFADSCLSAAVCSSAGDETVPSGIILNTAVEDTKIAIIGHNDTLPQILKELPENVSEVFIIFEDQLGAETETIEAVASSRNLSVNYYKCDTHSEKDLYDIARLSQHIVILNADGNDTDDPDMEAIFLLMNLRDIRNRYGLDFNITVEMLKESNQILAGRGDTTDFLVTSNMSSLILSQLAESPELIGVFREILSNEGNELYLKNAGVIGLIGPFTVRMLRKVLIENGYVLIGLLDGEMNSRFNLTLDETLELTNSDNLIVIGKD